MIEDDRILSCGNVDNQFKKRYGLPSNLHQLDYIQNNGLANLYLGGLFINETVVVQLEIEVEYWTGGGLIGTASEADNNDWRLFNFSDKHWYYDFKDQRVIAGTVTYNTRYKLELGNNYIKDLTTGSLIGEGSKVTSYTPKSELGVLCGTGYIYRLYDLKIWLNGSLVRKCVPCKDSTSTSDATNFGLYDYITKQYFTNAPGWTGGNEIAQKEISFATKPASTNFLKTVMSKYSISIGKPELTNNELDSRLVSAQLLKYTLNHILPYTRLQYIESTGTQLLDTNIYTNANTRIIAKVSPIKIGDNPGGFFFGSCGTTTYNDGYELYAYQGSTSGTNLFVMHNTVYKHSADYKIKAGDIIECDFNKSSFTSKLNGSNYFSCTFSNSMPTSKKTLKLFGLTRDATSYRGAVRFYYCKIYNNNNLLRNFIPAKSNDGEIGMYDLVTKTFYGNVKTGSFISGPEL